MPAFGTAGNPQDFYDKGHKHSTEMPAYLAAMGLDAYEYQFGRGVNMTEPTAEKIGAQAKEHNIRMSVHAPYYINLANPDPEKLQNSYRYILDSMEAAVWMGGTRVVVHPGSANAPGGREEALARAEKALGIVMAMADERGLMDSVILCPELMGKINQLGNLDEVIALCRLDERLLPTIDFGHLNARTHGSLQKAEDFRDVCLRIADGLGTERMKRMHIHFSRIEYTAGGEKRHHTFADTQYGPDFEPFAEVLCALEMDPVIICESRETQAHDALLMKQSYARCGGTEGNGGTDS